ncbi:MAG: glycogen-binding domain-containing protein [Kiritimatiellae bacterium]|nr:glycogen-binding domain-containing protein [Kiritimatiellia bacterium]
MKSCKKVAKAATKKATTPKAATPKAKRVTFTVNADPASTVFLAGSFNDWDPTAKQMTDKKNNGIFTATLNLVPGEYQYKFIINGTWCADPDCSDWVQNEHGTLNSIRRVEA